MEKIFKLGAEVFCFSLQEWGKIHHISKDPNDEYPLKFTSYTNREENREKSFTKDGFREPFMKRSDLSFTNDEALFYEWIDNTELKKGDRVYSYLFDSYGTIVNENENDDFKFVVLFDDEELVQTLKLLDPQNNLTGVVFYDEYGRLYHNEGNDDCRYDICPAHLVEECFGFDIHDPLTQDEIHERASNYNNSFNEMKDEILLQSLNANQSYKLKTIDDWKIFPNFSDGDKVWCYSNQKYGEVLSVQPNVVMVDFDTHVEAFDKAFDKDIINDLFYTKVEILGEPLTKLNCGIRIWSHKYQAYGYITEVRYRNNIQMFAVKFDGSDGEIMYHRNGAQQMFKCSDLYYAKDVPYSTFAAGERYYSVSCQEWGTIDCMSDEIYFTFDSGRKVIYKPNGAFHEYCKTPDLIKKDQNEKE